MVGFLPLACCWPGGAVRAFVVCVLWKAEGAMRADGSLCSFHSLALIWGAVSNVNRVVFGKHALPRSFPSQPVARSSKVPPRSPVLRRRYRTRIRLHRLC